MQYNQVLHDYDTTVFTQVKYFIDTLSLESLQS